jgi:type I restriction enzyme, S subunit
MIETTTHIKTEKQLVPALRFKEFEGNIEETLFGNHYSFHTTNSLSRDKLNYDKGEVRNIHYGDIHTKFQTHFYLTNEYIPFVNEDVDLSKTKEDSYCKVGDVVIADASEDYADIGKSIELIDINNEKLLAGLHTFLARPSSESTAIGYISCLLKSWKLRKQIMIIAQGTKVLSLSTGRVSKLKLNLPSLPEQQKIASFLSAVDEKIQQLTKKKALLEQYKKGVMQQLFPSTGSGQRSGQLRFKDENGKAYPDWEEKRLSDVSAIKKGEQLNKIELTKKGLYPSLSGGMGPSGYTNKWNTPENTITISEGGNSCGYVGLSISKFWCGGHCYSLLRIIESVNNSYLFQVLKYNEQRIMRLRVGSGLPNIQKKDLSVFKLSFPSLKEQQKIATYLSGIDTKIAAVNNQITQTQTFKKGLLQQMFV